jgi:hypothetical protein
MAGGVSGLGFSCICWAGKGQINTKRVRTNSLRAFGGGLTQGIDGMWGMRGIWLGVSRTLGFVYLYDWKRSQKHETSSNELISCIWRWVDAGNRWKVGYEGVWLRVSAALGFHATVGLEKVTETRNEFERTRFVHLEVG